MMSYLESQAVEALKDALRQISVIKVKDVRVQPQGRRGEKDIVAHVDIYGHSHFLDCKVRQNCQPLRVRRAMQDFKKLMGGVRQVTPILIAPSLSDEAQAVCRDNNIGFLDLEGNARVYLDEVFIVKKSHPKPLPPQAESLPTSETARIAHVA
jgi:hypothetical protein